MGQQLELGVDPGSLVVHLTTGADFDAILRYKVDGVVTDWPVGTEVSLVFEDNASSVWTSTVLTSDATFSVDKAVADALEDLIPVKLRYVNGTTDRIWYVGKVARHG